MRRSACSRKRQLAACLLILATTIALSVHPPLSAQSAGSDWQKAAGGKQEFDVASVRKNVDRKSYSNFPLNSGNAYSVMKDDTLGPSGTLFSARNQPLIHYIVFAYKLNGTQELALRFNYYNGIGLHVPDWVKNDGYDIQARAPGAATKDQMRLMMQSLLAERSKLAVHREMREAPVFALIAEKPGKLGPQIEPDPANDDCSSTQFPQDKAASAALSALPIPCGWIAHLPTNAPGERRFGGRNVTLAVLAESLPTQTGLVTIPRPVIDRTGLKGGYDFTLEWTPEDTSEVNNQETGGTFREALKNQLGLKLQPEKGPVELLVIDHVEQPSPN
jgi:uncharacterized protein (TIGR03435 family)